MARVLIAMALASATYTRTGAAAPVDAPAVPSALTLDDALKLFHARGYDLLIADAAVFAAEADVASAGAIPNPVIGGTFGKVVDSSYSTTNCGGCSKEVFAGGLSDNGAIVDSLSNKRGLRLAVARRALTVAKLSRSDVQRKLDTQVKQAYMTYATAVSTVRFAREDTGVARQDARAAQGPDPRQD